MSSAIGVLVGASGGIGHACLEALSPKASRIVAVGRNADRLPSTNDGVVSCAADIGTSRGRDAVVESVEALAGPIRFAVFASGLAHRAPLQDATEGDWDRILNANLVGPALLLARLLAFSWTEPSTLVIVGSVSGRLALPNRSIYGASKAGLEQFARAAAVELAPRRIAVNVVSAGVIDTPFLEGDRESLDAYVARRVPVGRMARADEVADLVAYLVDAPEYLTGAMIPLDGGLGIRG